MSIDLNVRGDLEVLRLQPGDTLICTITRGSVDPDLAERIREGLRAEFPGHEVLIVAEGLRLSIGREEVAA